MGWPGEQLLQHLSDTLLVNGIGSLLRPWQIRRVGLAEVETRRLEKLADAQTECDAAEIREGRKRLDDFTVDLSGLIIKRKETSSASTQTFDVEAMLAAAARDSIKDGIRKEYNVGLSILYAEEQLENDPTSPPKEKIDADWLHRWKANASDVSNETMQRLWGSVLAGELKTPGTYSLRCMEFLKNLSQAEAKDIEKLAVYVVGKGIWRQASILDAAGLEFGFLTRMQDLGIISGVSLTGVQSTWTSTSDDGFFSALTSNRKKVLIFRHSDRTKELTLPIYPLTVLGNEVLSLCNAEPDVPYLTALGKSVAKMDFAVTLADLQIHAEGTFAATNEVPISE